MAYVEGVEVLVPLAKNNFVCKGNKQIAKKLIHHIFCLFVSNTQGGSCAA